MAKSNSADGRTRSSVQIFVVAGLCCFFYILGAWQRSGFGKGDSIAVEITHKNMECDLGPNLSFDSHHGGEVSKINEFDSKPKVFEPCDARYIDYTPCQDQMRAMTFPRENMNYRERHCPPEEEKLHCLIPAPKGYVTPFSWPKSRDYVPYANAPYKSLTVEKAIQNWIQYEGNVFKFPGGGTQFPQGADKYIDQIASVIPVKNGNVRTALDTGCGVASWGAYLWSRNVIAMSFLLYFLWIAINDLTGKWLGSRQIRCNWATKGAGSNEDKHAKFSWAILCGKSIKVGFPDFVVVFSL